MRKLELFYSKSIRFMWRIPCRYRNEPRYDRANPEKMWKAEILRKVAWMPTQYPGEKSPKIPAEEIFLCKMAAIATNCLLLYPKIM